MNNFYMAIIYLLFNYVPVTYYSTLKLVLYGRNAIGSVFEGQVICAKQLEGIANKY